MTATLPWVRNLRVMSAAVFVVFTGFAFVIPFLPLYLRELGVADDRTAALWAGVMIGIAPLLAGLVAPFWGRLADRIGGRPVALVALASQAILLALSAQATTVAQLLLLRIAVGLTGGIGPLGLSMASAGAPREETGRAVGAIQAAQILAFAVGPLAGGLLSEAIGQRPTFLVTAALCGAAFVLVAALYVEPPRLSAAERPPPGDWRRVLRIPHLMSMLAVLFLVNFIGRSFTPVLPAYIASLGIPQGRVASAAGLLISVYSLAAAVSATMLGRVTRRSAPMPLLIATLAGGALAVLPMALVTSYPPLLALGVLLGLTAGGSLTLCYTIGGLLVGREARGSAFGLLSGAALVGGSISPTVAALLARWDLRGIFYADAALYALVAAALLLGGRNVAAAQPTPPPAG